MTWSWTHSLPPKFPAVPPPAPFAPNKNWTDIYQTCQAHSSTGHFLSYFVAVTYLTQMLGLCCALCSHLCADITPSEVLPLQQAHLKQPPSMSPSPLPCHFLTSLPPVTSLYIAIQLVTSMLCQCTNTQAAWGLELDLFCSSEYPQCW